MHRTPNRTAISLPCPPGTSKFFSTSPPPTRSLPLAFRAHFHVGPSLWRQLVPQSLGAICFFLLFFRPLRPPPHLFQRSVVKPLLNETCCGLERKKKGTTRIIFPEKVNSLSIVSKFSTGVRVSHPAAWLLTPLLWDVAHESRQQTGHYTLFPFASLSLLNL